MGKYCAQAVQMDFKEKTSSASSIDLCDVMPQYFDYAPEAQFMYRTYYSTEQWENMILKGDQATIGDVNGDGVVNIADVNATISIILNGH